MRVPDIPEYVVRHACDVAQYDDERTRCRGAPVDDHQSRDPRPAGGHESPGAASRSPSGATSGETSVPPSSERARARARKSAFRAQREPEQVAHGATPYITEALRMLRSLRSGSEAYGVFLRSHSVIYGVAPQAAEPLRRLRSGSVIYAALRSHSVSYGSVGYGAAP